MRDTIILAVQRGYDRMITRLRSGEPDEVVLHGAYDLRRAVEQFQDLNPELTVKVFVGVGSVDEDFDR